MTDKAKPDGHDTSGDVRGEGNYSASRRFDEAEQKFVKDHKAGIPAKGKEAEKALEGKEGEDLRKAAEKAKTHAHD
jgi:hypothetical protein